MLVLLRLTLCGGGRGLPDTGHEEHGSGRTV
jgi:hypothetical protein